MERAELTARALQTAKDRRIHVMRTARPNVYQVSSLSEPGTKRTVVVDGDVVACSCPGYRYRGSCCHSEATKSRIARERVTAQRQRPANVSDLYPDAA